MLWLQWRPFSARVEVLRRKQGAYSGIKAVCVLICIGRDAPFGAKPPQAGSHKSLMYLSVMKELFYHNGCKFTYVGVDQIRRRPLAVLLFRNCCKRNCISKDNGQFQKAKLRRARRCSRVWSHCGSVPRLLRVTKSANGFGCMCGIISPTSKTASCFWNLGIEVRGGRFQRQRVILREPEGRVEVLRR